MRALLGRLVAAIARLLVHGFFRRVEVVGADRIPRDRPLLVVANHFNGLVDPVVLAAALPRPPRFVAKATLGRLPPLRVLLRLVGIVLVQRRGDAVTGVDNRSSFAACHEVLRRGRAVAIFPEGTTHDLARMVELKTGAARIALGARDTGVRGITVVPVGLTFVDKVALRSSVLVRVGEPVDLDGDVGPGGEDDHEAVRSLTATITERLRVVSPDFDSVDEWWTFDAAAEVVLRTEDDPEPELLERALLANRLGRATPDARLAVRRRLADYVLALSLARLRDREVVASGSPTDLLSAVVRKALVVALLVPLVLAGSFVTAVPAALVALVGLFVTVPVSKGTVRVAVAAVAFPTAWGVAAAQFADGWGVAGLILVWAVSGFATVIAAERALNLVFVVLAWRVARERVTFLTGLREQRAALVDEVTAVVGVLPRR